MIVGALAALSSALLPASASVPQAAPAGPAHYAPTDTILILGAVPQEIPPYIEAMQDAEQKRSWGIPYWQGTIKGKPVVVAITGIGKTSTASVSTLFIEEFKPRLVLMSGTGARINKDLRTGDIIVATITYEHDYGSLTRDGMVYRPFNGPVNGKEIQNGFAPPASLLNAADRAIALYDGP